MKLVKLLPLFIILLGCSFAVRLMGFLFKIQHWTGGVPMSKYGNIGFFVSLGVVIILSITSNAKDLNRPFAYQPRILKSFIKVIIALLIIGVLFKIQHWKGADIQLLMAIPLLSIAIIIASCIVAYKVWKADRIKQ